PSLFLFFFFFQAEDGIRDFHVTGVQTCALPIFRVIVIDDHPLVHQGVAAVAALHEDLEFAGAAATTDEGLRLLAQQPDVAVVDLRLSGSSGLNLIEEGRRTAPGGRFVLLSSMLNPAAVRRALELGGP